MVRFIDVETGNVFNGSAPYVFWFDGEQSTNIFYTKNIYFLSDEREVDISINDNNIFKLLNIDELTPSSIDNISDFNYININDLIKNDNIVTSIGSPYNKFYVHVIYILGYADQPGSYQEMIKIDNENFQIGADFYGENESLYINLSNNGVEIPESIQKAFYESNIYEDKRDNILLNRKWKELLSNFIDIYTNKGSYKSLFNSLQWFDYGERIKLCEFWKNEDFHNTKYFAQEINPIIKEKYLDHIYNYSKTTYMGIYYAIEEYITDNNGNIEYDSEKNPLLRRCVDNLTAKDLSLKLCMLGNFYETYFMPIHLDLIHSTIEDIVYSNTFKIINGSIANRYDYINDINEMKCNVHNGDSFSLDNVKCYVGPNTLFGTKSIKHNSHIIGVQHNEVNENMTDEELSVYLSQLYNNVGSIIDFHIELPNPNDWVKKETLTVISPLHKQTNTDYKLIKSNKIDFSLLCESEGMYDIRLQFITMSDKIYSKRIKVNIYDSKSVKINVYRILNNGLDVQPYINLAGTPNDFIFSHNKSTFEKYKHYIPASVENQNEDWTGVKLNNLLVINTLNSIVKANDYIKENYFIFYRKTTENNYIIGISKRFGFKPDIDKLQINKPHYIYRNEYIYIPDFHILEMVGKDDEMDSFKVTNKDALCIIPDLKFGLDIEDFAWEFINASSIEQKSIRFNTNSPIISNKEYKTLEPGYYDIIFRYKLKGEDKTNEIKLDSAFIKL